MGVFKRLLKVAYVLIYCTGALVILTMSINSNFSIAGPVLKCDSGGPLISVNGVLSRKEGGDLTTTNGAVFGLINNDSMFRLVCSDRYLVYAPYREKNPTITNVVNKLNFMTKYNPKQYHFGIANKWIAEELPINYKVYGTGEKTGYAVGYFIGGFFIFSLIMKLLRFVAYYIFKNRKFSIRDFFKKWL